MTEPLGRNRKLRLCYALEKFRWNHIMEISIRFRRPCRSPSIRREAIFDNIDLDLRLYCGEKIYRRASLSSTHIPSSIKIGGKKCGRTDGHRVRICKVISTGADPRRKYDWKNAGMTKALQINLTVVMMTSHLSAYRDRARAHRNFASSPSNSNEPLCLVLHISAHQHRRLHQKLSLRSETKPECRSV